MTFLSFFPNLHVEFYHVGRRDERFAFFLAYESESTSGTGGGAETAADAVVEVHLCGPVVDGDGVHLAAGEAGFAAFAQFGVCLDIVVAGDEGARFGQFLEVAEEGAAAAAAEAHGEVLLHVARAHDETRLFCTVENLKGFFLGNLATQAVFDVVIGRRGEGETDLSGFRAAVTKEGFLLLADAFGDRDFTLDANDLAGVFIGCHPHGGGDAGVDGDDPELRRLDRGNLIPQRFVHVLLEILREVLGKRRNLVLVDADDEPAGGEDCFAAGA